MRLLGTVLLPAIATAARADPFNCTLIDPSAFTRITLTNNVPGMNVSFIPYGATLTNFYVPGKDGASYDVALGFDDTTQYCAAMVNGSAAHPYFGAAIGRVANRIAGGTFDLDGVTYNTPINELYTKTPSGPDGNKGDTLHGGTVGWDRRVWSVLRRNASSVTFGLLSPDGDMGFPGDVAVTVCYTLTDAGGANGEAPSWDIAYTATTSAATVIAMSQHTYWNLNANIGGTADALDHVVSIDADAFVAVDPNLIPTGDLPSVGDYPWMDFRVPKALGRDIANGTVAPGGGYDNAWVWGDAWAPGVLTPRVTMTSPLTGIGLVMSTDQPSVQGYSCNFLGTQPGGLVLPRKASQCPGGKPDPSGCVYQHWGCFVLEAQHYPDAVHNPAFPPIVLRAGEVYRQHTRYAFPTV